MSVIDYYELYIGNEIKRMPMFIYKDINNLKEIVRYVIFIKENMTVEDIVRGNFKGYVAHRNGIKTMIHKHFGSIRNCLNYCIDELPCKFNDKHRNLGYSTDEGIILIIEDFLKENNLSVDDIYKSALISKNDKKINALLSSVFEYSFYDMLEWYFNKKNLRFDKSKFNRVPVNHWKSKENRIVAIRDYCENQCDKSIVNYINNTEDLIGWINMYFKSELIINIFVYNNFYNSLYECLVDAYPEIKHNNILFEWEWHQCGIKSDDFLINMLREFTLFRMNEFVKNPKYDIPKYFNRTNIANIFPKLNRYLDKKRFDSYYDWCVLAFPEYSNYWTKNDFHKNIAFDGVICDSQEEKIIYEFIKYNLGVDTIIHIGNIRSGGYTYKLPESHKYKRFCPDFVVCDFDGAKLDKNIIIEYFGMYCDNPHNDIFVNYKNKTHSKINFYENLNDIEFIALYPYDIKDNFQGIRNKFSFLLEKEG